MTLARARRVIRSGVGGGTDDGERAHVRCAERQHTVVLQQDDAGGGGGARERRVRRRGHVCAQLVLARGRAVGSVEQAQPCHLARLWAGLGLGLGSGVRVGVGVGVGVGVRVRVRVGVRVQIRVSVHVRVLF